MASRRPLESLRLVDFSDREILLILNDVADAEGWATAIDMAAHINIKRDHPQKFVGGRLGWLYRYGAVERELMYDKEGRPKVTKHGKQRFTQRWRLTPIGRAMAMGTLKPNQTRAFEGLSEEQLIVAMRQMSAQYRKASMTGATLMKREWVYGMAQTNGNGRN